MRPAMIHNVRDRTAIKGQPASSTSSYTHGVGPERLDAVEVASVVEGLAGLSL